ncbi:hypothetical protein B4U79_15824 [Dinothrombium tinctorium]|uniref:Uncharacterized protein n=1 Tax=Dinothrombium tinctorium TaxID=1965070 RepID=A0A3S3QGG3_9ACAR|nr:hypothetical protein B4U79_15824 [Dinothrombium tinctorium]
MFLLQKRKNMQETLLVG